MEDQIQVGKSVKLKIGSPVMTIRYVNPLNSTVTCQWFEGEKLQQGLFAVESLKIVADNADSAGGYTMGSLV
ncbi:DUF2158 domain-containing protein [Spirosoma arcticum]